MNNFSTSSRVVLISACRGKVGVELEREILHWNLLWPFCSVVAASLVELLQLREISWNWTCFTKIFFKYTPDLQEALFLSSVIMYCIVLTPHAGRRDCLASNPLPTNIERG